MDLEVSQTFRYRIFLCICFSPKFQDYKLFHQWLKKKSVPANAANPVGLKKSGIKSYLRFPRRKWKGKSRLPLKIFI